jgi:hypothetical protein
MRSTTAEETLDDALDGLVERPHRQLRRDRRHLDGDVVHVLAGEEVERAVVPLRRLLLAEHGLAEEVEVEAGAVLAQLLDGGAEAGGRRVDHEVADHGAQDAARDRDDDAGDDGGEEAADRDRALEVPGQEARRELGDLLEVVAGDEERLRPHDAVDEAHREREPVGVLEDAGEALRRRVDGRVGALRDPAFREDRRLGRESREVLGVSVGGRGVRLLRDRRRHRCCYLQGANGSMAA